MEIIKQDNDADEHHHHEHFEKDIYPPDGINSSIHDSIVLSMYHVHDLSHSSVNVKGEM